MKPTLLGLAAGALLAGLACWLLRPDFAALEAAKRQADDSVAALRVRLAERAQTDSARADSARTLAQAAAAARRSATAARGLAQAARHALDSASAQDTALRALIEQQRGSYEDALAADSVQLTALSRLVSLKDRQIASRDSSIRELQAGLASITADRDRWHRAARAPVLLRLAKTGATMLAAGLTCRLIPGETRPC